ncbi:NADH-quinone oxidoreductase subunit M [Candidatus Bathyarchaeota archaeon ex4484_135]|nr:MAG: NADH-quinone oxidoreductase subunit M [Candidatus Bathyarchaeota archaeon ex4484_135]
MMVPVPCPLLQAVLSPLLASALALSLAGKLKSRVGWLVGPVLSYQVLLLGLVGLRVWLEGPILERYTWVPVPSVGVDLLADGLSVPVALAMALICACLAFYSIRYIEYRVEAIYVPEEATKGHYYAIYYGLYPLFSAGLVGIALSGNLIVIWFFMELLLIPFYFIMAYFGYIDRRRIAMMCFLWGTAASVVFMAGAFTAYACVKSFSIRALSALAGHRYAFLACVLMAVGLLIKMAAFGFHVWLPWVHAEHPTCIAGILACYANIGAYVMARVLVLAVPEVFRALSTPLMIWALITMVYGAALTLAQDDVKRLCACSTISQVGYSLLGVSSMVPTAVAGGIFYMVSHLLGKAVLFSTAGLLVYETHERDIRRMGGLGRFLPLTAVLWASGSMILSAIPPFSGFPAEMVMFSGIFRSAIGHAIRLATAICGVLATALTAAYTFWPLKRIFMGQVRTNPSSGAVREAPPSMLVPLFILALASAALGICPRLVMEFLSSIF